MRAQTVGTCHASDNILGVFAHTDECLWFQIRHNKLDFTLQYVLYISKKRFIFEGDVSH